MGEAWGDLTAAEYLYENNFRAPGDTPFVTGAYVTGNTTTGIRDYDASKSPLNYSDVGFDLVGPEVHADGEIWVATNLRVRPALVKRYGHGTPSLQQRCADGRCRSTPARATGAGSQLMFDSYLLQAASQVSMLDMRDNMLAADLVRFGGANQDADLGRVRRVRPGPGRGEPAPADTDPTPSFASPYANNATRDLRPLGDAAGRGDPALRRRLRGAGGAGRRHRPGDRRSPDTFQIVPNTSFTFVATGPGFGHQRFTALFLGGRSQDLRLNLPRNLASTAAGAGSPATGSTSTSSATTPRPPTGRRSTALPASRSPWTWPATAPQMVQHGQRQRAAPPGHHRRRRPAGAEPVHRAALVRDLACDAAVADCPTDAGYRTDLPQPERRVPRPGRSGRWRPQLNLRTFRLARPRATHVRIRGPGQPVHRRPALRR